MTFTTRKRLLVYAVATTQFMAFKRRFEHRKIIAPH
ncbi:hypothetical protein MAV101_12180 [Mycobacterium avium subsp. hominissuis 101]|nr:hypothetical protein MAVA5_10720 [Mycobacterium avium subsp. hominissuis A5]KDP06241.1 hypothetical protein MAV101_12180 [Mycobacterium avium subsp. hominissuis 101]